MKKQTFIEFILQEDASILIPVCKDYALNIVDELNSTEFPFEMKVVFKDIILPEGTIEHTSAPMVGIQLCRMLGVM